MGQSEVADLVVLPAETEDTILEPNPKCRDKKGSGSQLADNRVKLSS